MLNNRQIDNKKFETYKKCNSTQWQNINNGIHRWEGGIRKNINFLKYTEWDHPNEKRQMLHILSHIWFQHWNVLFSVFHLKSSISISDIRGLDTIKYR